MTGEIISHYRILEKLGKGGMGVVYKAEDLKLGRHVAVKFLPDELSKDNRALERFQREARSISALNHPNICTIYEVDEHQGRHFIVMELLEGQPLNERVGGVPADAGLVLQVGVQIADALTAAQAKGITHRDLKPANIFLTQLGQAKLLDFGLAKVQQEEPAGNADASSQPTVSQLLSTPGVVMGTVDYMSPEQALGRPVDQRTDIFSLGVVLYQMAAGRLPFAGLSASEAIVHIVRDPPDSIFQFNPAAPPELERVIRKCLEKDRERRYQSASDLAIDLKNLQRDMGQGTATRAHATPSLPSRRFAWAGLAAALFSLAIMIGFTRGWRRLPGTTSAGRIESLAVLPLENLSGDPAQDYFADGMTEALIAGLGQIRALRKVTSRTSVMQFKGTKKPLPEIARTLDVDAVVEGSVVRSGQRVRITARLIEAATERQIWAQSYERNLGDVLDLQSELTRAVVGEIQIELTPNEKSRFARSRPVNAQAFEAYLKGRDYLSQFTADSFGKAIEQFEQAIRLEPRYAAAYAGLAESWQNLEYVGAVPYAEAHPKALGAAGKAADLDDSLAEAHAALGAVRSDEWDHQTAEKEFRRAIELHPGYVLAHVYFTTELRHQGRGPESIAEAKRALSLDPLALLANEGLADAYLSARYYDLAIEQYSRTLELHPDHSTSRYLRGWAYVYKGMYAQGKQDILESLRLEGGDPALSPDLAYIAAVTGKPEETKKTLRQLLDLAKKTPVPPGYLALIYIALGEKDRAFHMLDQALLERSSMMLWLKTDPRFDSLRSDPRFVSMLKRVGFD